MTPPPAARCPTPFWSDDDRHIADLGGATSVDIRSGLRPPCRGCGTRLIDDPRYPQHWVTDGYLIKEEPW